MRSPKIKKLIIGVHMGLGHDGLRKLLEKEEIYLDRLAAQDLVMCLNGRGDKLKVIGCKGLVLGYLKMPKGQRIMKEALQYIPTTFGAGGFDYDSACKRALDERFNFTRKHGPLNDARAMKQAGL